MTHKLNTYSKLEDQGCVSCTTMNVSTKPPAQVRLFPKDGRPAWPMEVSTMLVCTTFVPTTAPCFQPSRECGQGACQHRNYFVLILSQKLRINKVK